jgi:hypothetical protein
MPIFPKLYRYFGNRNVSTNRAPQAGAPSGRTAQYFAIAAMLELVTALAPSTNQNAREREANNEF